MKSTAILRNQILQMWWLRSNMKYTLIALLILAFMIWHSIRVDNMVKTVEYCFDQNGEHYVVPDERCQ